MKVSELLEGGSAVARTRHHRIIFIAWSSPRTWLRSGRDRVCHVMSVDVSGKVADLGSRNKGGGLKGKDRLLCRAHTAWPREFFLTYSSNA